MCLAYWIFKATSIHSEYVVLLGFAQQCLRERSSILSLYYNVLFFSVLIFPLIKVLSSLSLFFLKEVFLLK